MSASWVAQSIDPRVSVRDGQGYGYGWWINTKTTPNIFEAIGRGGQRISVLPGQDTVIVFTGGGIDTDEIAPYLLKAITAGDRFLALNPAAMARLRAALAAATRPPDPTPPAALPDQARLLSGRTYMLDANPMDWRSLSLNVASRDRASLTLGVGDQTWTAPIGLNGRYRFTQAPSSQSPWAVRGGWSSDQGFLLDLNTVSGVNHFLVRIAPAGDREARLTIDEVTGELKGLSLIGRTAGGPRGVRP